MFLLRFHLFFFTFLLRASIHVHYVIVFLRAKRTPDARQPQEGARGV